MTNIVIPDSVKDIYGSAGDPAFCGCYNLIEDDNGICYVDNWAIGISSKTQSDTNKHIIREGTVGIANQAFILFENKTEIVIPQSLKYVCQNAFPNWVSTWKKAERIYYSGTYEDWIKIEIDSYNENIENVPIYYYSENEPFEKGPFWHYVDGVPTVW